MSIMSPFNLGLLDWKMFLYLRATIKEKGKNDKTLHFKDIFYSK